MEPPIERASFRKLMQLSRQSVSVGDAPPTHVIWPETAIPLSLSTAPGALRLVAEAAPVGGSLLTGAPGNPRRYKDCVNLEQFSYRDCGWDCAETYDKHPPCAIWGVYSS